MLVSVARAAGPRDADHPLRRPRQSCLGGQLPAARLPLQVDLLHHLLVQLPLPDLQHLVDAAARRAAARRDPRVFTRSFRPRVDPESERLRSPARTTCPGSAPVHRPLSSSTSPLTTSAT